MATGNPLPLCDQCRWLCRSWPYLYESGDYELDIPIESRNLNPEPDFDREGFLDCLDEFSEKQLRSRLRQAYLARGKRLLNSELREEHDSLQQDEEMNKKLVGWLQENARVVVYPAEGQAA